MSSRLVQVTVVPAFTVTRSGTNTKLSIVTEAALFCASDGAMTQAPFQIDGRPKVNGSLVEEPSFGGQSDTSPDVQAFGDAPDSQAPCEDLRRLSGAQKVARANARNRQTCKMGRQEPRLAPPRVAGKERCRLAVRCLGAAARGALRVAAPAAC